MKSFPIGTAICSAGLFLCLLLIKPGYRKDKAGQSSLYNYKSECLIYSDLTSLYTVDTTRSMLPFFNRTSLQVLQGFISCGITRTILVDWNDSLLVYYKINSPSLEITQTGYAFDAEKIKADLEKPVIVTEHLSGKFLSVCTDRSISPVSESFIKNILSQFQFVKTPGNPSQWQTTETNTNGNYHAAYRITPGRSQELTFTKRNAGYTNRPAYQSLQQMNVQDLYTYQLDSLHQLRELNGSEALITRAGKDTISIAGNKTSIKRYHTSGISIFKCIRYLRTSDYKTSTLSMLLTEETIRANSYAHTLGNSDWNELSQQLSALQNPRTGEKDSLIMKIRALAYLHPGTISSITNRLLHEAFDSPGFEILSTALGRTAIEKASTSLASILYQRREEKEAALVLLSCLATHSAPSPEAIGIVKQIICAPRTDLEHRTAAELTLGAMAYQCRTRNKAAGDDLVRYILKHMRTDHDSIQQLLVMGNTGNPLILPYLLPLISGKNVSKQVKLKAIAALRFIREPAVDSTLSTLERTADHEIRLLVTDLATFRKTIR